MNNKKIDYLITIKTDKEINNLDPNIIIVNKGNI